jgi:tetratricopeptide (TPR) repeat protein
MSEGIGEGEDKTKLIRGLEAYSEGRPLHAIAELRGRPDLTPEELCLLGSIELSRREYYAAELHLLRPHLMGMQRATVRYAAVFLETGRVQAARELLEPILAHHDSPQRAEALHLLALAEMQEGRYAPAAERANEAVQHLLSLGQDFNAAPPLITAAWANAQMGELDRAEAVIRIALVVCPEHPDSSQRVRALSVLAWALGVQGRAAEAEALLEQARALVSQSEQLEAHSFRLFAEHEVHCWNARPSQAHLCREELAHALPPGSHWWTWIYLQRARQAIPEQKWAEAFMALGPCDVQRPEVQLVRGILLTELDEQPEAEQLLRAAQTKFLEQNRVLEAAQASAALARLLTGAEREQAVRCSFDLLLSTPHLKPGQNVLHRLELMTDTLTPGTLTPGTLTAGIQPRLEAARMHLTPAPERPRVNLYALGKPKATLNGEVVRLPVALLACLLLDGEQTRGTLELKLYPEKSAEAAGSAVKQDIFQARRALGAAAIVSRGAKHASAYHLSDRINWKLDLQEVLQGCSQLDSVRVFHALDHAPGGEVLPEWPSEWTASLQSGIEEGVLQMTRLLLHTYRRQHLHAQAAHLLRQFGEHYPDHPQLESLQSGEQGLGTAFLPELPRSTAEPEVHEETRFAFAASLTPPISTLSAPNISAPNITAPNVTAPTEN